MPVYLRLEAGRLSYRNDLTEGNTPLERSSRFCRQPARQGGESRMSASKSHHFEILASAESLSLNGVCIGVASRLFCFHRLRESPALAHIKPDNPSRVAWGGGAKMDSTAPDGIAH